MNYLEMLNSVAFENAMMKTASLQKNAGFGWLRKVFGLADDAASAAAKNDGLSKTTIRKVVNDPAPKRKYKVAPDLYMTDADRMLRHPSNEEIDKAVRQAKAYKENAVDFHKKNNPWLGYDARNWYGNKQVRYPNSIMWWDVNDPGLGSAAPTMKNYTDIVHANNVMENGINAATHRSIQMRLAPYQKINPSGRSWFRDLGGKTPDTLPKPIYEAVDSHVPIERKADGFVARGKRPGESGFYSLLKQDELDKAKNDLGLLEQMKARAAAKKK